MITKNIRTFKRETTGKYRELIQINDSENTIKIYSQEKEVGFPFSEYTTSLTKYGYKSSNDFFKSISKREKENLKHVTIEEVDTSMQIASEIGGLLKLAKYRKDHNCYNSLIFNDGTIRNDIIDRLKKYGLSEEEAVKKINLILDYGIERHAVKVTFENNDSLTTEINGEVKEIKNYYMDNVFNIGIVEDNFQKVVNVEFLR